MHNEIVRFFVDGDAVVGTLYLPDSGTPCPGVVYCQGFGGTREYIAPDLAERLTRDGLALLAFDHRGIGDSGGRPNRLMPNELVEDVRSAALFLSMRSDIVPTAIGLFGVSFGGAIAIAAAAGNDTINATVSCVPFADGSTWMRDIRRYWEWVEFCERLERDRRVAVASGHSEIVDPDEILIRDPESIEWSLWLKAQYPSRRSFQLSLSSAAALLEFRPIDVAHRVKNLLVLTVDHDTLIPSEHAQRLFDCAPEPKSLHIVADATHHDIYRQPAIDETAKVAIAWLNSAMGGH